MRPVGARRDPAPSRWAYRLHRLWLTPLFRGILRVGLPAGLAAFAAGAWLSDQDRADALRTAVHDVRRAIEERPEFTVRLMAIDGASPGVDEDIREILPVEFPTTSFDLDLEHMRAVITGLDAVKSAQLRIRPGGILRVTVTEREPAAIWRAEHGLDLLDRDGHRVAPLDARTDRPDLPLIAGQGADAHVAEALALVRAAHPIAGRLRGLVRVGERRWDVVLDRGQRILLPEEAPVAALERVIALSLAPDEDLLARDITVVDMRHSARPTVRLAPDAVREYRRMKTLEATALAGASNG